ncbi:putative neurotrophin receptor LTRK 1 [Physella acuta]|uniref:putative neurotrophin receptor LTRK 1 n=1 Tax=Physella acuta TaxID=109671 RepID=UPI0027DC8F98|nr:putative neurotrophin receptor LTRK 1 [Physella acuta]
MNFRSTTWLSRGLLTLLYMTLQPVSSTNQTEQTATSSEVQSSTNVSSVNIAQFQQFKNNDSDSHDSAQDETPVLLMDHVQNVDQDFGCPSACTCSRNSSAHVTIECTKLDTLQTVPGMDKVKAAEVVRIVIENQPRLISLGRDELQNFTNLKRLVIKRTGLKEIKDDAFRDLKALQELHLSDNVLQRFPKQWIQGLVLKDLNLDGNILADCQCGDAWLWDSNFTRHQNLSCDVNDPSSTDRFSCVAAQYQVPTVRRPCAAPRVNATVTATEHRIEYVISGMPVPRIHWLQNGQYIDNGPGIYCKKLLTKSGLVLVVLQVEDEMRELGNLTLVATNSEGSQAETVMVVGGFFDQGQGQGGHNDSAGLKEINISQISSELVVSFVVGISATVVTFMLVLCLYRTWRSKFNLITRRKHHLPPPTGKGLDSQERVPMKGLQFVDNPNYKQTINYYHSFKNLELQSLKLVKGIGEGAFGRVFLGTCTSATNEETVTLVAVKTLKGENCYKLQEDLEREAEVLSTMEHKNIITFYGVCRDNGRLLLIFEYMENGDLNNYLRTHGPDRFIFFKDCQPDSQEQLNQDELMSIVIQIANGMEYLASQHIVHRDLATRNCLVGKNLVVKISDFGMSRDVYTTDYYKVNGSAMVPVRWMSPETFMYRSFTLESDVWSFGVVIWEIFTYGKQPWYEYSNVEVIDQIKNSRILEQPSCCPHGVYSIMMGCWKTNPQERLTMADICKLLQKERDTSYLEIIA